MQTAIELSQEREATLKTLERIKKLDDEIFVKQAMFQDVISLQIKRQQLVAMLPFGIEPLRKVETEYYCSIDDEYYAQVDWVGGYEGAA